LPLTKNTSHLPQKLNIQEISEIMAIYQKYQSFTRKNGHLPEIKGHLQEIMAIYQKYQEFTRRTSHLPEIVAIYQK
jgi:hypothetical protein